MAGVWQSGADESALLEPALDVPYRLEVRKRVARQRGCVGSSANEQ